MPAPAGHVPIIATLAAAWSFFRANVAAIAPFAIAMAVLSTVVWVYVPMPGGSPPPVAVQALFPLWAMFAPLLLAALRGADVGVIDPLLGFVLVGAVGAASVGYWAYLLRRAITPPGAPRPSLGEDWARLMRVFASVWFLILILSLAALIIIAFMLSAAMTSAGVTQAEILEVQNDQQAVMAIVDRAMASPAGLAVWGVMAALAFGFVWMFARLCLSGPATIAQSKAMAFDAWSYTKGDGLRIAAVYTVLALPVIALTIAPFLMIDPSIEADAGARAAAANALLVAQGVSALVQTLIVMPMMAGAGAFLYAGLKPR